MDTGIAGILAVSLVGAVCFTMAWRETLVSTEVIVDNEEGRKTVEGSLGLR